MDTNKISLEEISAFADGEPVDSCSDAIIAALRQEEGKHTWDVYHKIGDVLRSDDLAFAMRPDFAARIAARLEAEPTILSPQMAPASKAEIEPDTRHTGSYFKRYGMPGAAVAAVAVIALLGAPQWMAASKGVGTGSGTATATATATVPSSLSRVAGAESADAGSQIIAVKAQNGVILRDPRIDDYLLAHQRFSPSVYSSTQFARSAAFSNDSNK